MERTKLEWSPSLSKNIQEISLYFKKSSSCLDNKIILREKEKNSSAIHFSNVELKLNSTDIFAVSNAGTVLAFRIDSFIVEKSILRMQFELDGLKVQHFIQPKKPFQCLKSSEIKNYVLNFRTVKFDYEDKVIWFYIKIFLFIVLFLIIFIYNKVKTLNI
ncbi:uncharacterized protein LOC111632196 [Centruroides sculpturatus]|uniref:uncharacterized protein LOC111632196 n=1 Tax=Centruroides sculpturatus TaxID=218467 RepID=UPI000C6EDF40|nr:uncharacterized protein LOC111632196 [Centruroides sculpturatus]